MTFKEFFEEIRKEGRDSQEVEDIKNWMLDFLRGEGFTDEQINKMKMKDVQKNLPRTLDLRKCLCARLGQRKN